MVLHKKHLILKTVRESLLKGDSLSQAWSVCRFIGYTDSQIDYTLKIFSDLEGQVDITDQNFWELLSVEIFDYVLNDIFFESYLEFEEEGLWIINTQYVPNESVLIIDYLRLLDICHYSGFQLYIKIPIKIKIDERVTENIDQYRSQFGLPKDFINCPDGATIQPKIANTQKPCIVGIASVQTSPQITLIRKWAS